MDLTDFKTVEAVVSDPLRFKAKLNIGGDAYTSLRVGKTLQELWDVSGAAATGVGLATSGPVASFFFGGGWLASLGLATAATPIGWVVVAGVASAGTYYGVIRLAKNFQSSRVQELPKFINTPIDLLGASLLDLIGTLAVKVSHVDDKYDENERNAILRFFVEEWGYDPNYTEIALKLIAENDGEQSLPEAVGILVDFKRSNPDCNYHSMRTDICDFLREVIEADGFLDEREERALQQVEDLLLAGGRNRLAKVAHYAKSTVARAVSKRWPIKKTNQLKAGDTQ